jgi:UPF0042 nucleotide-binding protein
MHLTIVTGISGSGKSLAIRVLEDAGFYCIDNLPVAFLADVVDALEDEGHDKIAVSVDARTGNSLANLRGVVRQCSLRGDDVKVLFLNARTDSLVQRYSETRRRHPLTQPSQRLSEAESAPTLQESIEKERELLSEVEDLGIAIDTSDLHPNVLRQWVRDVVEVGRAQLMLMFESFAFKHGVPLDADLVFDVRCLPNPFYDPVLRPLTGLDRPVAEFLGANAAVRKMIDDIGRFLDDWLPDYVNENRHYLTVALGCTGGQHRSVYCVQQLAARFSKSQRVLVRHRSLAARTSAPSVAQTA